MSEETINIYTDCFDIFEEEIVRLRTSLEDVWAIQQNGIMTPEKNRKSDELLFGVNTLEVLRDVLADKYHEKISELREKMDD